MLVDAWPQPPRGRNVTEADFLADLAHVVMLVECGIVDRLAGGSLLEALETTRVHFASGQQGEALTGSASSEIERYVADLIGHELAGALHLGRSSVDREAAVPRLVAREWLMALHQRLLALVEVEIELAFRHVHTVMPGWTHLQPAEPWTLAHYILGQVAVHLRHLDRLEETFARVNLSAQGGASLVGAAFPLNRERVAELLGHDDIIWLALDAGAFVLDWVTELVAVASMVMLDLGRLSGDLILWSSSEFGLISQGKEITSPSSMPGKRNPAALERLRAEAGLAIGWLPAHAGVARTASTTDGDSVFVPWPGESCLRTAAEQTGAMLSILQNIEVDVELMDRRACESWGAASGLVDLLVRDHGVPYQQAYDLVTLVVGEARRLGHTPAQLTEELFDSVARPKLGRALAVSQESLRTALNPRAFLASRLTAGSAESRETLKSAAHASSLHQRHVAWQGARTEQLGRARGSLADAVRHVVDSAPPS